jgi:hypothetical protein
MSPMFNKQLIHLLFCVCGFFALCVSAQEAPTEPNVIDEEPVNTVKFMAKDKFMLSGKYYAGKKDHSAVLLLHDCKYGSQSYYRLIQVLTSHGIHALTLDLRGFGESISAEFSHKYIKSISKDIATYQSELFKLKSFWQGDVLEAYNYLRSMIDKKRDVAVVSSGCSASQSVFLAEKMRIHSFVLFTPILDYMEKESFKNLIDIPVYFVNTVHEKETYQTGKELFDWNGDNRSIFQLFKGSGQGLSLLKRKRYLSHDIALWLDDTLSK